jgi:hypothetical protein
MRVHSWSDLIDDGFDFKLAQLVYLVEHASRTCSKTVELDDVTKVVFILEESQKYIDLMLSLGPVAHQHEMGRAFGLVAELMTKVKRKV